MPRSAWREPGSVLLVSCYELGRQPLNIASPWAHLEAAGFGVTAVDTAIEPLSAEHTSQARLIAISVPMHTALRLALELSGELRRQAPEAHLCFFGLYAALNAELLLEEAADSVIGGEIEVALTQLAQTLARHQGKLPAGLAVAGVARHRNELVRVESGPSTAQAVLEKLPFLRPHRARLPPLQRYAAFVPKDKETRTAGYLEASRGCLHQCLHCPVTAVYRGRLFIVPKEIVLADAEQQVACGAKHLSFGDPDFFNGPKHTMSLLRELHARHPEVSFDVTTKVANLLKHRRYVAELGQLGCAFIISAVESLSDLVLQQLDKGHGRADVFEALKICRGAKVSLRPSLVAFTPWTTLQDYIEMVDWVVDEALIDHIEPIQFGIRLLIPPGSALLWQQQRRPWLSGFVAEDLSYRWTHPDRRMDQLHEQVSELLQTRADDDPGEVVVAIRSLAYAAAGRRASAVTPPERRFVPRMSETWFCCAEPSRKQRDQLDPDCDSCAK